MAVDVLTGADLSKYSVSRVSLGLEGGVPMTSFQNTEAWDLLGQYGKLEDYDLPSGGRATILPSFSIPIDYLDKNNWAKVIPMGNFREVKAIRILADAAKPAIVAKSPERVLTQDRTKLETGSPWWGGKRSKERPIYIGDNSVVEEQAVWEAIILLELKRQGVRAEVPQAFIQHQDGKMELIVKEINSPREDMRRNGPSWEEIFDRVAEIGLMPVDSGGHNSLVDEEGYTTLIDTNRWLWPPYTDNYRRRLVNEVATAVFSLSSLMPGR